MSYRIESDTLGEMKVPADALYGAQTARAVDNFPISGLTFQRPFIRALGLIKHAAAETNTELGLLDKKIGEAISKAALEVADGLHDRHFVVDVFQTGSGTSTNMNANEVIANRALEILGLSRGDKKTVHPNDHVNMGQSTNDVIPTAINVSAAEQIVKKLIPALELLENELAKKASEFSEYVKSGRTHFQDAVPVTFGQEFSGYATMVKKSRRRILNALESLYELPIGGTAVGTGLNAHPKFGELMVQKLSRLTGLNFRVAENRFEAMGTRDCCLEASAALRSTAVSLLKICNDLRILSSGPNTGIGEIELPAVQPGSSIMPGKVNPVIVESAMLAAAQIIGYDRAIEEACRIGELELNMGFPLIAYDLLQSIEILANTCENLALKCIRGITVNVEKARRIAESSPALVTVVAPKIGYDKAARIAKKMLSENKTIKQALVEEGVVKPDEVDKLIDLLKITKGGIMGKE
ncbi:MAG: class II fumarate hydratase [Candidatus Caldarchaeum sp.]|nr:class II fumarate hydratase [Candidatus Caldarchaeum sp.]MDW8435552.1 class II fumarate hydratase [Candidatus Caldarchaeum sp.]